MAVVFVRRHKAPYHMIALHIVRTIIWRLLGAVRWLALITLMLLVLRSSTLRLGEPYFAIAATVTHAHFDYVGWELAAIRAKVGQATAGTHAYTSEDTRTDFVRTYFDDLAQVTQLEAAIEAVYVDPDVRDSDAVTAEQRAERDTRRDSLFRRQSAAEAILQGQVAAVLVEEGFGVGGQVLPPLNMRFTGRTLLLVTSPRDEIDMRHPMTLTPIPVDEREAIEQRIFAEQDLAAVIVPIGGMALYPAMIVETTSLPYTVETFAHEWLHHYLMFYPLGWGAELSGEPAARIINETTASIFGREIGRRVLARYYPDLVPPEPPPPPATPPDDAPTPQPPAFDYNAEMNETRVTVDELLAAGDIEEAETYMAERRELFVENGYAIRKLNQAWFAFYGGYQVEGISAGGEDPIGRPCSNSGTPTPRCAPGCSKCATSPPARPC